MRKALVPVRPCAVVIPYCEGDVNPETLSAEMKFKQCPAQVVGDNCICPEHWRSVSPDLKRVVIDENKRAHGAKSKRWVEAMNLCLQAIVKALCDQEIRRIREKHEQQNGSVGPSVDSARIEPKSDRSILVEGGQERACDAGHGHAVLGLDGGDIP
jgi:hypothetical protein